MGREHPLTYVRLFVDCAEAANALTDAERGRLFSAILAYAATGETPEFTGSERFVFLMIKTQIDREAANYEELCGKRRAAGALGGRARGEAFAKKRSNCKEEEDEEEDEDEYEDEEKDKDELCELTTSKRVCTRRARAGKGSGRRGPNAAEAAETAGAGISGVDESEPEALDKLKEGASTVKSGAAGKKKARGSGADNGAVAGKKARGGAKGREAKDEYGRVGGDTGERGGAENGERVVADDSGRVGADDGGRGMSGVSGASVASGAGGRTCADSLLSAVEYGGGAGAELCAGTAARSGEAVENPVEKGDASVEKSAGYALPPTAAEVSHFFREVCGVLEGALKQARLFVAYNESLGWACLPDWRYAAKRWAIHMKDDPLTGSVEDFFFSGRARDG